MTTTNEQYPFPPPTIIKWLNRETVNMDTLADELGHWAEWAEEEDERMDDLKSLIRDGGLTPARFEEIYRQVHG